MMASVTQGLQTLRCSIARLTNPAIMDIQEYKTSLLMSNEDNRKVCTKQNMKAHFLKSVQSHCALLLQSQRHGSITQQSTTYFA